MTNSTRAHGAPRWRPLAALVGMVVAVHVLVLQATPAQLAAFGSSSELDDAAGKTFATRSIEAPVPPVVVPEAPALVPAAKPAVGQAPEIRQKRPLAPEIRAPIAPEIIANAGISFPAPLPEIAASAPVPTPTLAQATPPDTAALNAAVAGAVSAALNAASPGLPAAPQTTPVTAISLPGSARLQYKMTGMSKGLNYQAAAELIWKASADKYEASMKVSAFLVGSRSMSSVGQITAGGLAPTRFADKSRTEQAAHFDAAKGKITFSGNTPDAPWVEGAQDRVSVFIQLGGILAARPTEFSPGTGVTIYTAGPREAEAWTFVVESTESLDLLGAPLQTLKLTRKPRREFDQKVEVWYAPSLGYLPVRNRITQANGDFVDQQISEVSRP